MRLCSLFLIVAATCVAAGCRREERHDTPSPTETAHAGAASGEQRAGFEQLAIELSAKAACDRLRGQFRALPDNGSVDVPTGTVGTVWIRDCLAVVAKNRVTFTIAGHAWQRTPRELTVVEFTERSDGHLGASYDSAKREVTIKYEPSMPDTFTVLPTRGTNTNLGDQIVSAIALGLVAPGGRLEISQEPLSPRQGLTAHVPMCTGIPSFEFGTEPFARTSDDSRPTIDVRADVPSLFGPLPATTRDVTMLAIRGKSKVDFLCEQDAAALAKRFAETGKLGAFKPILSKEVRGSGQVAIPTSNCRVTMLVRASSARSRTTMSWYIRAAELPVVDAAPLRCTVPGHDDDKIRRY